MGGCVPNSQNSDTKEDSGGLCREISGKDKTKTTELRNDGGNAQGLPTNMVSTV